MSYQYVYELSAGRIGLSLVIDRLTETGAISTQLDTVLNARGFQINVYGPSEDSLAVIGPVCDFESFQYPNDVQESEIDFIRAVNGPFDDWVIDTIMLCSVLCSQWAAGHSEERLHETIRNSLALWNS